MAINVKISNNLQPGAEPIRINIKEPASIPIKIPAPSTTVVEYKLNMRRTLNGDIMIFDHKEIDIIILMEKKKVVAFAKDTITDSVYGAEKRLFDYLRKRGIVQYDSIEGGNVYGSLQGMLYESKEVDAVKMTLYEISRWMSDEAPLMDEDYGDMVNDLMLNPDEEESTELGEVPHETEKGSILQRGMFAPYLYGRYTY
jgi:hypothetical protein